MKRKFLIAAIISFFIAGLAAYGLCSSETTNLGLTKPTKGDRNWGATVNNNMDLLDAAYGNYQTTADDLPQVYVYSDTFNSTTGRTITLPNAVGAVTEYSVSITPTTRDGAIGDIYVTKTTTNFVVKCVEANTTDTFAAVVYYTGDASQYGGSIYRRWYVSPDSSITDHGNASTTGSLAWVAAQISTSPAVIEAPGNKGYQLKQDLTLASNISYQPQPGAIIDTDFSIRDSNYEWYQNGATSEYYLQASGGGNPNINMPSTAIEDNARMTDGAAGSLATGEWDWNDVNGLGYSTVYVRLSDSTDPDGKAADYVEAGYAVTFDGLPSIVSHNQDAFSGLGILKIINGTMSSSYRRVNLAGLSYEIASPIVLIANSEIFNGTITNLTPGSDVIQIPGSAPTPVNDIKIHDLKIISTADAGSCGIDADYSDNLQVYNCHFDTMDTGVSLANCDNAVIKNNYMTDVQTGVYPADSDSCKTINNHIVDGNNTWPGTGSGINYITCDNGIIDGNTVYNVGDDGIVANTASLDIVISNNNISTCGRYGIVVDNGSTGARVIGNKVDTVTQTAMAINENEHAIIGNEIRDCSQTALAIEDSSYVTVMGNYITDCGTTTAHHGILGNGTVNGVHYNTITGNVIEGVTGESIAIIGTTGGAIGNVISSNVIDTPYRGITLTTMTKTKMANNTIAGAGIAANRIMMTNSEDTKGDLTIMSTVIDLSGAADEGYLYYPRQQGTVLSIAIYFQEATSADDGVRLRVGATSNAAKFMDIPAGAGSTVVSQTADTSITWYLGEDAEAVLGAGIITADDYIRWFSAGGKVGTGTIIIILEICLHG